MVAELEDVDAWLNEQIDHIAEVQANLHLIEDESGTLETTWKNLNELQTVVVCVCTNRFRIVLINVHGYPCMCMWVRSLCW